MTVTVPGTENDEGVFFWMDGPRREEDLQMQKFMEGMRKDRFAYRSKITGTVPLDFPIEDGQLESMKFVKPVEPGKFYVDPSGRKYKCVAIEGEQIRWMMLDSWQQGRQIDAEFMQDSKYSANYSPLLDSAETSRLERRYLLLSSQDKS